MAIEIAEVVEVDKQYQPSRNRWGFPLKLGAVKIRTGQGVGGPLIEQFAFPIGNFMQTPLKGEHIAVIKGPSSMTSPTGWFPSYYYLGPIATSGNKHLNPMPGSLDFGKTGGSSFGGMLMNAGPAIYAKKTYKPGVHFEQKKDVMNMQPYEGDVMIEGRRGNSIRMGCALGMADNPMNYSVKSPFFKGKKSGSPIIILANGHPTGLSAEMASLKKFGITFKTSDYGIEDPKKTDTILIMTKDHKIDMDLAKSNNKIGTGVAKLSTYLKPQIIGSSERIILNAKKDEIILIAKKDVKVVTKKWNTDMEEFFQQVLDFMEEVIKQNTELEKLHKELGAVAQSNATSIHPTGVGPSGPPTNAGSFIKSKTKATTGASKTKSIRKQLEKIKDKVKDMKE